MATHWEKQLSLSKENEFRSGQQRKIQLKNNNQKIVQTSSLTIFSSDVLKDVN
jgi:hypothetical protein